MNKILIFSDWFSPAYKAGGPIRSVENLAYLLRESYQIFILCSDQDEDGTKIIGSNELNVWKDYDSNIKVQYLSHSKQTLSYYKKILFELDAEFIYLNSAFSLRFSILPLFLNKVYQIKGKLILAPRGMLHEGAMKYKKLKKQVFLLFGRIMGLYNKIYFHATDSQEQIDINKRLSVEQSKVSIIGNVPSNIASSIRNISKNSGELKVVYVSRVSPKKNLDFLIKILKEVNLKISLSIIGPIEDQEYYLGCKALATDSLDNISFLGAVKPESIRGHLEAVHLYALPTFGENFGHAIFEAFASGRPVLISDQTPWRQLESKGIGYDIPLDNKAAYISAIKKFIDMDQAEFNSYCKRSLDYARSYVEDQEFEEKYTKLFS